MTPDLDTRVQQLESDLAFLVRHLELAAAGHATIGEYERLAAIRDRYARGTPTTAEEAR